MGHAVGSTKPKKISYASAKVKSVYKGSEKIWSSGYDQGVAVFLKSSNVYDIFISEDKWATCTKNLSEVTLGGTQSYIRIERYNNEVIYIIIQSYSSGGVYIYKLDIDSKSVSLVTYFDAPSGQIARLCSKDGIIPFTKRDANNTNAWYMSMFRCSDETITDWVYIGDNSTGYISITENKSAFKESSSYDFLTRIYDPATGVIGSHIWKTLTQTEVRSVTSMLYLFDVLVFIYDGKIGYSTDGNTFTIIATWASTHYPNMTGFNQVAFGNNRYVFSTSATGGSYGIVLTTTDGKSFTKAELTISNSSSRLAYDGKQFVISYYGSPSLFYTSDDGIVWTQHSVAATTGAGYSNPFLIG